MMVFLVTVFSIGTEIKYSTSRKWLDMGGSSIAVSLLGKLLPQTAIFTVVGFMYCAVLLAKLIGGFQKQYAAVSFELFTSSSDLLHDKLDKGLLDVAILQAPVDTTNYDYLRLPIRETWCVLMRSDAPLASKNAITASDLSGLPIILPARLQARSEIFNWLSGDIAKMRFIGNSNLLANTAVFVEQCGYYGISVQMPLLDEKRFTYRPLTPALHSDILLVWRRDRQQSLTLQKFLQFAKCFLSIE